MKLKLVLSLVVILVLSCKENTSKVQDNVSMTEQNSNMLSETDKTNESKRLMIAIEKVFAKESENKNRGKLISKFFIKSRLTDSDKKEVLGKVMSKLELATEDRKEISLAINRYQKMESK